MNKIQWSWEIEWKWEEPYDCQSLEPAALKVISNYNAVRGSLGRSSRLLELGRDFWEALNDKAARALDSAGKESCTYRENPADLQKVAPRVWKRILMLMRKLPESQEEMILLKDKSEQYMIFTESDLKKSPLCACFISISLFISSNHTRKNYWFIRYWAMDSEKN